VAGVRSRGSNNCWVICLDLRRSPTGACQEAPLPPPLSPQHPDFSFCDFTTLCLSEKWARFCCEQKRQGFWYYKTVLADFLAV
jgi:hypothetical protein